MSRRSNRAIAFANQQLSVKTAAIILAGATLLSSLLGVMRDRILNGFYLYSYPTGIDAYTVAFILPDFMFSILISGALTVTLVPVFNSLRNDKRSKGDEKAWELASSMVNLMSLVGLILSILMMIFAEPLIRYVVGPNLSEASRALAASMMRVIAINPFLFSISGVLSTIQQATGRYVFYAIAPAVYNIGIIIGTLFFTNGITIFGYQIFEGGIMGVALGVLLGSIMQVIVSSIGVIGLGFDYKFRINWRARGFRKVMRIFPARSLDQGVDYFNSLIETRLASGMPAGTIRSYNQALTLHAMPINLIGVAISNAAFASMTEKLALDQTAQFRKQVQSILRIIIWIALPVASIAYFTRGYLVNFLSRGGDNYLMASILGVLVLAIFFRSVYHILARTYYARQDTKTPLLVSIAAVIVNIILAVWFVKGLRMGAIGLAWAQVASSIVEAGVLFVILYFKVRNLFDRELIEAVIKMIISSVVTGAVTYVMVTIMPLAESDKTMFATLSKFGVICLVVAPVYLLMSRLLHVEEVNPILRRLRQIFFGVPVFIKGKNGRSK